MTTGLVGAVGTLIALRDRATRGGSYRIDASIVAANVYALRQDVGLYPTEIVEEGRKRFEWGEMRASHHVLDLMKVVCRGWIGHEGSEQQKRHKMGEHAKEDSGFFQTFEGSSFGGQRLSILRPVVRYVTNAKDGKEVEEVGVTPKWKTPSGPHGFQRKIDVTFDV